MTTLVGARLFIAAFVAYAATGAQAQCSLWDASGKWTMAPENGKTISLALSNGTVEGAMKENLSRIKTTWSGKEIESETYIAKVESDRKLDGTALIFAPLSKTIKWSSDQPSSVSTP